MATLNTHVYFLQNILNRGPRSDDSRYSNRLIAHALKQARGLLIKKKLDKYDYISNANYQTICVPLTLQTHQNCSCIGAINDCKLLRSNTFLPTEITSKWDSSLDVLYLDGRKIPQSNLTLDGFAKYSISNKKGRTAWFVDNRYLYIINNSKLKLVTAKAIWEDPEEASTYCINVGEECNQYNSPNFPMDTELNFPMYKLALELLGLQYPEDNRNDSRAVEAVQSLEPNETKA